MSPSVVPVRVDAASRDGPSKRALPLAAALALAGALVHNRMELPGVPLWSPENAAPILVTLGLVAWWWQAPGRSPALAFVAWSLLQLVVGAVLTVLPLPLWSFVPEQTPAHYLAHVVYGVTQVPLLVLALRVVRVTRSG